jgi:uncharacterized protein YndB with AHSA1/START domain
MSDERPVPLEAAIDIDAPSDRVWAVVSDLQRMGEWSPECRKMIVFGTTRKGAHVLGLNRRGWAVWPTNSTIVRYEPGRAIGWRVFENRATWSYELEPTGGGTRLVERRSAPANGLPQLSALFARVFLGGVAGHDAELLEGMRATLARIKAEAERAA